MVDDSYYVSDDIWVHPDLEVNRGWTDGKPQRMVGLEFKYYAIFTENGGVDLSWYTNQQGEMIRC